MTGSKRNETDMGIGGCMKFSRRMELERKYKRWIASSTDSEGFHISDCLSSFIVFLMQEGMLKPENDPRDEQIANLQRIFLDQENTLQTRNNQIATLQARILDLETATDWQRKRITELSAKNDELEGLNACLKPTPPDSLKAKVQELEKKYEEMRQDSLAARRVADYRRNQLDYYEAEIQRLKYEINAWRNGERLRIKTDSGHGILREENGKPILNIDGIDCALGGLCIEPDNSIRDTANGEPVGNAPESSQTNESKPRQPMTCDEVIAAHNNLCDAMASALTDMAHGMSNWFALGTSMERAAKRIMSLTDPPE